MKKTIIICYIIQIIILLFFLTNGFLLFIPIAAFFIPIIFIANLMINYSIFASASWKALEIISPANYKKMLLFRYVRGFGYYTFLWNKDKDEDTEELRTYIKYLKYDFILSVIILYEMVFMFIFYAWRN